MSTLRTSTYGNLATLASTANTGDTYYETDNNRIVTWNGTNWTYYDNDGSVAPYLNTYSMQFDGSDEYLDLGTGSALDFTSDMSVSFWMYWTAASANYDWVFSKGVWPNVQYSLYTRPGGAFTFATNGGSLVTGNTANGTISLNTWHHVAVTVESGVSSGTKIYIDGTATTLSGTFTLASRSSDALIISNPNAGGGVGSFQGLIDEFAVFNSALSSTNVAALRDTGGANPVPADISTLYPTGWWRMGDGTASWDGTNWTIPDQTTNGNDATSVNMEEADRVSGSGNIPG